MHWARMRTLGMLSILAMLAATPLIADDKTKQRDSTIELELDQDEALARLQRSELKPLSQVLAAGQKVITGEVVRARLKRVRERLAYELKIITAKGRVREVYIDAVTLDTIKVE